MTGPDSPDPRPREWYEWWEDGRVCINARWVFTGPDKGLTVGWAIRNEKERCDNRRLARRIAQGRRLKRPLQLDPLPENESLRDKFCTVVLARFNQDYTPSKKICKMLQDNNCAPGISQMAQRREFAAQERLAEWFLAEMFANHPVMSGDGPPYDAATRTGMYDQGDV